MCPNAIKWYTGEAQPPISDDEGAGTLGEEDEEDEEDDEEDEEDEEDEAEKEEEPPMKKSKLGSGTKVDDILL